MSSVDLAVALVQKPYVRWKTGVAASFAAIDEDWGVKYWQHASNRDEAYALQAEFAEVGLGPKLGDKFNTTRSNGSKVYCYLTEVVTPIRDTPEYREKELISYDAAWKHSHKLELELQKSLAEHNLEIGDLHCNNFGYTKEGNLVVLDFGND